MNKKLQEAKEAALAAALAALSCAVDRTIRLATTAGKYSDGQTAAAAAFIAAAEVIAEALKDKFPAAALKNVIADARAADKAGEAANRDSGNSTLNDAEYATGAMLNAAEAIIEANIVANPFAA